MFYFITFRKTEEICVVSSDMSVNEEVHINITATNYMVTKTEYDDPTYFIDKEVVQTDNKIRGSACIASESGYVSSDNDSDDDSDRDNGNDDEISNIDPEYEASDINYMKQERIASIFLF